MDCIQRHCSYISYHNGAYFVGGMRRTLIICFWIVNLLTTFGVVGWYRSLFIGLKIEKAIGGGTYESSL